MFRSGRDSSTSSELSGPFDKLKVVPSVVEGRARSRGDNARAVILPGGPPFTLAFFANEEMERVENYESMEIALFRANDVRRSLESDGWTADESEEVRSTKNETRKRQVL